jgi:hypothetical protein
MGTNTKRDLLMGTFYGYLPSDIRTKQLMEQDGSDKILREM